jgi:methionyl aminopeptidase
VGASCWGLVPGASRRRAPPPEEVLREQAHRSLVLRAGPLFGNRVGRVQYAFPDAGADEERSDEEADSGMADAAGAAGAAEVSAEDLLAAIKEIKAANPDFGIKRVWSTLKESKGMEVSEKRVKKFMQENGLTESNSGGTEGAGDGGEGSEQTAEQQKKKSANKKQKDKARDKAAFEEWCKKVLADSAHLVEGVSPEKRMAMPYEFTNYEFSGPLRPAYVTPQVTVPEGIPKPDYADTSDPVSEREMRGNHAVDCKEGDDAEGMRLAGRLGREVIDIAGRFLKVGVTGDEIDRIVHAASLERKCYPSPLNYYRFPKSVCVSPNEVICHGIPDCRPIEDGDIINLDVTVYVEYKGKRYHGDLNETYLVGNCDEESVKLVKCAYDCLKAACDMIKPGTMYRDLGSSIAQVAAQNGCSVVKGYCGHGIGTLFHTAPNVPHYKKNKAVGIMRAGHTFTVEPMINLGSSWADISWPDNWTAVTKDGKRSAQFEHTFLVTDTGVEILTARQGASRTEMSWDLAAIQR